MSGVNEVDILHDNQSSDYNLLVNDELNVSQETQDFCDLVVNLSPLPMRAPLDEGVDDQIFFDDDEVEYDDEEEEEDDEEDEDEEDEDDDDEIDKHYGSDDSESIAVGENYQLFIRLISNEVDRHAPFHYRSWQEVPGDVKMSILTTLHHYFDLQQYHNTEHWDGIKLGIQFDRANRYKDLKTKLKKHFDKEGGYDNTARAKQNPPKGMDPEEWVQIIDGLFTTSSYKNRSLKNTANRSKQLYQSYHRTQSYAQRRYDEVKEGGEPQHVEGWRDMHFKRSSGWGVGRKVKSITPDLPPHMYVPAANELQQQLVEANARWAEQQRINETMQQQINMLMSMQGGQGSSSFYHPGFETNQEKDQEEEEEEDEEEDEDEDE
ncbi:hypothetical protein R6Q57_003980 [Mikania cordata]